MTVLVATRDTVYVVEEPSGDVREAEGVEDVSPACLAADVRGPGAWMGTVAHGVLRSEDGGRSWRAAGLDGEHVTALAVSHSRPPRVWAGTEPSAIRVLEAGDGGWRPREGILDLPSADTWSFPPRPETHHVRWLACHPTDPGRLWAAIEAGALISTDDGGRTWRDRVPGGPYDTHELAIHPAAPERLHVAAGDGYYRSADAGRTWSSPGRGLDVGYFRSVMPDPADPEVVVLSGASHAHAAYVAGRSDGRVYRRRGTEPWERVRRGWPDEPDTIAPLLCPDAAGGRLLAADERGVHGSIDGGRTWERLAGYPDRPPWIRGLAVVAEP